MSLVDQFGMERFWRIPEGLLVFGVSARLRIGSIVGTQLIAGSSQGVVGLQGGVMSTNSHPVMGSIINRLMVGRLVLSAVMILRGMMDSGRLLGDVLFSGLLVVDTGSQYAKVMLRLATAGCLLASHSHAVILGMYAFEFPIRVGLATMGLMVMVSANDFVGRYLGLEWQSLCLYVRAAFRRGSAYSTEAGLKYFILGAVASAFYLFGASRVYGVTGSVNFSEIHRRLMGSDLFGPDALGSSVRILGVRLILSAFFFKLAVAPFHAWAPDVYEGSPLPSTLYFAVVPKLAIVLVVIRLVFGVFSELFVVIQPVRLFCAGFSRLVSAFSARVQRRLKRFRAYSAIGHLGYIFLGLSAGSLEGMQGALVYISRYVVMSMCGWLAVMSLTRFHTSSLIHGVSDTSDHDVVSAKFLSDLGGLGRFNPFLAATIAVTVRSMAGIPPLAGFVAKMWVFFGAMSQSLVAFSLLAVITSCIGAFYYLRLVKMMYFESGVSSGKEFQFQQPVDGFAAWVLGLGVLIRCVLMVVPGPLMMLTHRVSLSLLS